MLWLPALNVDGCPRRLPLADRSSPALAALLIDGENQRVGAAHEALAADPPLALWTIVCAAQSGRPDLTTIGALADWLARHIERALRWPEGADSTPVERGWIDRYLRLRQTSLAVAQRARGLAGTGPSADEAYLLGLVHAARDWWSLDGVGRASPSKDTASRGQCPPYGICGERIMASAVPPWLAAALDLLTRPSEFSGAVACVFESLQSTAKVEPILDDAPPGVGDAALAESLPKLAAALARYAQIRDGFERQLETEKLEAMAEFAAGAGHEINNPLAVIAGRAQLLLADETNPERRRELAIMNTQAMRVFEMISDMMLFARPPKPQMAACDLSAIVERVLSELAGKIAERNATVERLGDSQPLTVMGDAVQLAVAVRAVCDNALGVIGRGGKITITLRRPAGADSRGEALVAIGDNGPGIPPDVRRHLFDPFYSGRRAGRGLGMGLAKCWRIVANHGGSIDVESEAGEGACFTIRLPISQVGGSPI